ncbi:MAG: hypothetical protein J7501_12000 [Bdellovibrio sp.]|nr:hypothetical protein [Bdellovibrio sp.]
MRYLIMVVSLLLPFFAYGAKSHGIIEIVDTEYGTQEVWAEFQIYGKPVKRKVGDVEVIKKGTHLYHWGRATPEQAKQWNEAGKISPELLQRLLQQQGRVGGGFYASLNPVDSSSYGNTLMVIDVPHDIEIVRSISNDGSIPWAWLSRSLLQSGLSGVGNDNVRQWMTIIDANALTKEFVMGVNEFKKITFNKLFAPSQTSLFQQAHPEFASSSNFVDLHARSKAAMEKMSLGGANSQDTFQEVLKIGSEIMVEQAIAVFGEESLTFEVLVKFGKEEGALTNLLRSFYPSAPIHTTIRQAALISEFSYDRRTANSFLLASEDKVEATRLLQEAEKYWGAKLPKEIATTIDTLKSSKSWFPAPVCSQVFAN